VTRANATTNSSLNCMCIVAHDVEFVLRFARSLLRNRSHGRGSSHRDVDKQRSTKRRCLVHHASFPSQRHVALAQRTSKL